ncbi:meiotic recombination protein REC114 [Melanerpes formicivorus]|uniref:meiotic recombination protein REC114 n=1 Tax=Melanerpes formicivorus TaxID=211600 RepID=UPI003590195A
MPSLRFPAAPSAPGMAVAGEAPSSSAPGPAGDASLLGSARTWPLKRYGRFLPPRDGDSEGQNTSWKVFESSEESGHLTLTIVVSGHFFISQGRTVLEGFSLIDSHKWLQIVRRADCLLFRAQAKSECRMFRVQFGGAAKEQMLEFCCSCVQKLAEYLPVQVTDGPGQQLHPSLSQAAEPSLDSCTALGERRSVTQLAQSVLRKTSELPLLYQHSAWQAEELGPFIRLCLLDQQFPAFVEDVEKELSKLTEG